MFLIVVARRRSTFPLKVFTLFAELLSAPLFDRSQLSERGPTSRKVVVVLELVLVSRYATLTYKPYKRIINMSELIEKNLF